ncbi:MAG: lasso peptide biosynthesis B2 protein [Pseudomonadota bacterium]
MPLRLRRRAVLFALHFGLLVKSWLLLLVVRATLSFKGYAPVLQWIREATPNPRQDVPYTTIVWAIHHTAKAVPDATCLTRSLAMRYLLAQAGEAATIQIGVKNDDNGKFKAHAWVVLDGEVLTGDTDEEIASYKLLVAL